MMLCAALVQRRETVSLYDEHQDLINRLASVPDASAQTQPAESNSTAPHMTGNAVSSELLRLRNQVNLLRQRRQELDGIRSENKRLRLLFDERQSNPPLALPPGYIRRSQALFVGYSKPEDTIQSFLWAIHNRDVTNTLLALTPEQADWLQSQAGRPGSLEKLFSNYEAFMGFSIVGTQRFDDGTLQVDMELIPGLPPIAVNLHKIGNEWKMRSPP
jgi:hypothetical protein